jgi:hypothetical protein
VTAVAGDVAEIEVPAEPAELAADLARRGLSDGLPVVPPTPERVEAMLAHSSIAADEVMGLMPPANGIVTPRYIAVNGVLAGCLPAHLPVLIAAAQALLDPAFNLFALQPTTNPVGPLVIVHGPVVEQLGMNAGTGCFGPGNHANAVIGRAVRLMTQNLGRGRPGVTDHATHGWPGKYTFCAAENAPATPWDPFHVRRGGAVGDSAVTLFGVQAQHSIINQTPKDGYEMLQLAGRGMAAVGTNNHTLGGEALLVISPEQAAQLAATGIDYEQAARVLFEYARIDSTTLPDRYVRFVAARRPAWADPARMPIVDRWEDVQLLVAGGAGIFSLYMPSFGDTRAVTKTVVPA